MPPVSVEDWILLYLNHFTLFQRKGPVWFSWLKSFICSDLLLKQLFSCSIKCDKSSLKKMGRQDQLISHIDGLSDRLYVRLSSFNESDGNSSGWWL